MGVLGATTYTVHLRLIGKRVVDFLLMMTELFSLGVMALRRYERKSIENRRFRMGQFGPKF